MLGKPAKCVDVHTNSEQLETAIIGCVSLSDVHYNSASSQCHFLATSQCRSVPPESGLQPVVRPNAHGDVY